jgi:two-component system chemotaxis response regulator CheY
MMLGDISGTGRQREGIRPDGSPYQVLIIDDSVFVTKQLSQILMSEGFEIIDVAYDGEEGVKKFEALKDKIDLVTMDVTMPKLDGLAALEKILSIDPKAQVVMISALGKQELVKESLLKGAKNYIVKPLDREKVLERIVATVQKF